MDRKAQSFVDNRHLDAELNNLTSQLLDEASGSSGNSWSPVQQLAVALLRSVPVCLLVLPTGFGKTAIFTAAHLIEHAQWVKDIEQSAPSASPFPTL